MQHAQNGPSAHPPTPVRQDAPFHRQGRSERRCESYCEPYVEPLSDASTPLADCYSILLELRGQVGLDHLRLITRRVAFQDRAVGTDEELGEVPFDRLGAENTGLL